MSFEASIETEKAPSSTAVSGHSAESGSGLSALSQGSSEALPGVDPGCGRDRDFVAELTSRWGTCKTQKAKVALVDELYEITFETKEEELEEVFGDIAIIEFDGRYTSSQQLGHIIDQFKKVQHYINHSNDKSCFDERDGKLHVGWPLPDGVPKDYKYPNPRYPKRGPLTFDQPEPNIPLNDSITLTSEAETGSTTSRAAGPHETATFVPKGYIWGKDYVYEFIKEWNDCDGENDESYKALVKKYFEWTMFWCERYFINTILPIRYDSGDRDEQRNRILLYLRDFEALQHQKGQLATSSWQGVVDEDSDNERP